MRDLEDAAARPPRAVVQPGAASHTRPLHAGPAAAAAAAAVAAVSPAAPIYTPYQLPPLLQTANTSNSGGGAQGAGPYSATPSPASAFPLDPRFPPPPFSTAIPGHATLGAPPPGDVTVQHNRFDALMNLQALGSRDAAGPSGGGSGGDGSYMALETSSSGAELPPRIVQKADRSCKKCVLSTFHSQAVPSCGSGRRPVRLMPRLPRCAGAVREEFGAEERCAVVAMFPLPSGECAR